MIVFCPKCSHGLEQTGRMNTFVCFDCKCIYETSFTITEISGPETHEDDFRKLKLSRVNEDFS